MPSLVILLFVSGVYWDNGYCLKYFLFYFYVILYFIWLHEVLIWKLLGGDVSHTQTHTLQTSRVWQCPIWGGCHLLVGREHVTSYPTQRCGKMGWGGGGDQVSAISHEAAGLCPDPYTSTGLAQLIKVTPSPPTSTPYLRVGPLSHCVQFGAAADYLFIYLPIIWFLFSD